MAESVHGSAWPELHGNASGWAKGCRDRAQGRGDVAQGFRGKQDADPVGCAPKRRSIGPDVAQLHQRVLYQRMGDDVCRHEGLF